MSSSPIPFPSTHRAVRWSRDIPGYDRRSSGGGTGSWRSGPDADDLTGRSDRLSASSRSGSALGNRVVSSSTMEDMSDEEDDAPPPMMQLNPLTRALLEREHEAGPEPIRIESARDRPPKLDRPREKATELSLRELNRKTDPDEELQEEKIESYADVRNERRGRPDVERDRRDPNSYLDPHYERQYSNYRDLGHDEPDPEFELDTHTRSPSHARSAGRASRASSHSGLIPPEGLLNGTNSHTSHTNYTGHGHTGGLSAGSGSATLAGDMSAVPAMAPAGGGAPGTPEKRHVFAESTPVPAQSTRIKRAGLLGAPARRRRAAVDDDLADHPIQEAPEYGLREEDVDAEMDLERDIGERHDADYPADYAPHEYRSGRSRAHQPRETRDDRPSSRPVSRDQQQLQAAAHDQENVVVTALRNMKDLEIDRDRDRDREREWERDRALSARSANTYVRPDDPDHAASKRKHHLGPSAAPIPAPTPIKSTPAKTDGSRNRRRRTHFTVNGKQYAQLWRLGKGGSADVYQVMDESGQTYALKRVRLDKADETALAGFRGEIELLRALQEVDRVVDLFDWQVDEVKQCLSVLLEAGDTDLGTILKSKEELDLPFVRYYWREMLACVAAVHEHDIVHSDLKPANFVSVGGALKLIDFGIAGAIDIDHTVHVHREAHVGTPNYMSPESLTDSNARRQPGGPTRSGSSKLMKVGKPADVWSLGCILYQFVYGRPPFAHIANPLSRIMTIMRKDEEIQYPALGLGDLPVPASLIRTMKRCLAWEPVLRPTVEKLLDQNDAFLYPDSIIEGGTSGTNGSILTDSTTSTATTVTNGVVIKDDEVVMSRDLLAQIISRIGARFGDKKKEMPTEEELKGYPAVFFNRIKEYQVKEQQQQQQLSQQQQQPLQNSQPHPRPAGLRDGRRR